MLPDSDNAQARYRERPASSLDLAPVSDLWSAIVSGLDTDSISGLFHRDNIGLERTDTARSSSKNHCAPATARTVLKRVFFTRRLLSRSVSIHSSSECERSALPTRGIVTAWMPRLIGILESVEPHS